MKKKIKLIMLITFTILSFSSFSQEMSNEKNNKIIIMDGEQQGWLEVFVDPTNFDCECINRISFILKPTQAKNIFKTDDKRISLEIKDKIYVFSVLNNTDCCYLKPGKYD